MNHLQIATEIAAVYAERAEVRAVALGGSVASGTHDEASDIDLYVYADGGVDIGLRASIVAERADHAEVDNRYWEWGDEWIERASGRRVDVMFRAPDWIEDQLDRVLDRHEPALGYTTCLWHNVRTLVPLVDRSGWLEALKGRAASPYPEPLARAIIAKNHPLLRSAMPSFANQLATAIARGDRVAANHRAAALLASYFDILFALNRRTHPGEKRLVAYATALPLRPPGLSDDVDALLGQVATAAPPTAVTSLVDRLDALLRHRGEQPLHRAGPAS